ncbi:MAG: hypothetical protein M0P73_05950 [Syntrophobacterales bacterium]|jgi:hypothetical protein|nr:hypothetical protein [Syntrophobacterales bacterium]
MVDSSIIDFCIGMTFFYVILTLICTMINEYIIERWRNLRANYLLEGIAGLFYDAQNVFDIYTHPLIRGLYYDKEQPVAPAAKTGKPNPPKTEDSLAACLEPFDKIKKYLPSYIPSRTFVTALLDTLAPATKADNPQDFSQLREIVFNSGNNRIKGALLPLIDAAAGDLEKARQNIEKWFDDSMDRISGWFKRRAKAWLLLVAAVVCILLNADSIMVGNMLWQNKALRAAVVASAENFAKKKPSPEDKQAAKTTQELQTAIQAEIDKSKLPLGWVWRGEPAKPGEAAKAADPRELPSGRDQVFFKIIGIILTTLAISLGAPFWTDLLNSFVNLRRTGNKPAKAEEEKK